MELHVVLSYIVALALPVWLVGEQILSWWMFDEELGQERESAGAQSTLASAPDTAPSRLPRQAA
jgi:hypothetical protein